MSIYIALLKILLGLVFTAINIVEFFLLVEIVMLWKEIPWLKPFATAGKDLVTNFTTFTNKLFHRFTSRSLSGKGSIIIAIAILELLKLLISAVY